MKKLSDVLTFVQAGGRPIVTFNEAISQCEAYAEAGMKARIIGVRQNEADVLLFNLDYSEFDDHNKPLESRNYYDKSGNATLTARESGYYKPVENVYLTPTDDTSTVFSIESEAATDLFAEFQKARVPEDKTSYVAWLEQSLLDARQAVAERATVGFGAMGKDIVKNGTRTVLDSLRAIASDAFDGLADFYPAVLTADRKEGVIRSAVADAFSASMTGGPAVDYDVLKTSIESAAKQDESNRRDWSDLAESACDDLLAFYPRALTEEGRVAFIDRALAHVAADGAYPEVKDREDSRDRVKQLIGQDAAERSVPTHSS